MIDWCLPQWKSNGVRPIAVSQLRQKQQGMFLMNPGDWIKTNCGVWCLTHTGSNIMPVLQLL